MKTKHLSTFLVPILALSLLACLCPPKQDCISFDPGQAEVKQMGSTWKIVVGSMMMLDFGSNEGEARQALKIIKHYGMDQQCFVGRPDPSMEYYLVGGSSPSGSYPGEDCISFDPDNIEVKKLGNRWKIVDGNSIMLDFDDNEAEANHALEILKCFKFTEQCFVGRPDASMSYFRQ